MRLSAVSIALLCCAAPAQAAEDCLTVHGRLALYNGTPSFRIWQIGTKHVFAIPDGPPSHEADNLPENVRVLIAVKLETRVYGDFRVCPLEPARAGKMQRVRVESANISATQ
jgi:hypothetical protein